MRYRWIVSRLMVLALTAIIASGWRFGGVQAQTDPPPPDMPPLPQGLDPPPTVYPPTEISRGSYVYYQVCMACHGDRGQGLTDEWRGALDVPDQNCWQSKCHAANHPPGGFVFPKVVPSVYGPQMAARFHTGLDLYQFIKAKMPFQAPGSLKDEEYWQLTAFLLSLNGVDPGPSPLDPERAGRLILGKPVLDPALTVAPSGIPSQPGFYFSLTLVLILGVVLGGVVVALMVLRN